MDIKFILRRMRVLRTLYYKNQFKKECKKIPVPEYEQSIEKLKKLKDAHKGERCFIIGNGPSLTVSDLEKLSKEVTFAANRINSIYEDTTFRPTYYCIQDDMVINNMINELNDVINESEAAFLSTKLYDQYTDDIRNNEKLIYMPMCYVPPKKNMYMFSDEADNQVYEGLTITYSAIQLAAYMGFKKIFLLGVDHNYSIELDSDGNIIKNDASVKNYFGKAEVDLSSINLPKVVEMTRAYISAEKFSRQHDFRIYNATRGGKLEAFERVNLDEIL